MRAIRAAAAVACGALITACAAPAPKGVPALLIEPDAATRAELVRAVSSEFGTATVALAGDALTVSPELVIERTWPRDAEGRPVNGRELGRPEIFHLVRVAAQCVLVHDRNGRRIVLATARCAGR